MCVCLVRSRVKGEGSKVGRKVACQQAAHKSQTNF